MAEVNDPGRHERLVTVDEEGTRMAIIENRGRRFIFVPKFIGKRLNEANSNPEKLIQIIYT